MDQLQMLLNQRNIRSVKDCPITGYSTFRIGGAARLAVFPNSREQLVQALACVLESRARYAVIGRGSNILFPDGAFDGAVIFTASANEITDNGHFLEASAGASLTAIAIRARNLSTSSFVAISC